MQIKRIAIAAAAVAAVAAGSAGAVAATGGGKQEEQAVIDDAAKRLNVTPEALRDALGAALDARLDQAVEDGRLTREQADEIKRRRQESGRVLGPGPRGGPGHRGPGFGPRGRRGPGMLQDVAEALGISARQLHERLHDGETIAEIAEDEGKQLAAVKKAVRAAVRERLDAAVEAGRLTDARRDRMLEHLDEHIDRLGDIPRRPPRMP